MRGWINIYTDCTIIGIILEAFYEKTLWKGLPQGFFEQPLSRFLNGFLEILSSGSPPESSKQEKDLFYKKNLKKI